MVPLQLKFQLAEHNLIFANIMLFYLYAGLNFLIFILNCRGSLYRLLHKSGAKEALDERRRLSMAYDVVST